ncbi:MAG TPA: nucleoside deaminase [Verrucomicrobiae bacterium]|nr:nucleoside deaminase [Verrucomicrobiae bacterium]
MNPDFMRETIRLAIESVRTGGGPFGAVMVRDGTVVGRGANQVTARNDPTAHAEIVAIRDACERLKTFQLSDCDLYASCEPCPMCLGAIYWARIKWVYYAGARSDAAEAGFDDDFIYREMAVPFEGRTLTMEQVMREEALAAFKAWAGKTDKVPY